MSETDNFKQEKKSEMSSRTRLTIDIVGAAIFGALSAIAYPILKPLIDATRVPQGLALFDPISIIWMTCFLVFGPLAGILCCFVGFVTLIPFDTSIPVIAPLMKLCATLPLVIAPTLFLRLYKREGNSLNSPKLKKPKNYLISAVLGIIVRIIVMVLLNIVVYVAFFGWGGLEAWLVLIVWINALTSVWDLFIPYGLIYGTKLNQKFELW
jgi:hypothetical protein